MFGNSGPFLRVLGFSFISCFSTSISDSCSSHFISIFHPLYSFYSFFLYFVFLLLVFSIFLLFLLVFSIFCFFYNRNPYRKASAMAGL